MKRLIWIAVLAAVGFVLWGCNDSDTETATSTLKDYGTGVVKTLGTVSADGTKTLQAGTADTHEVETDGNWIVWKGRSINLGYYDGTGVTDLDTGLSGSITPWAFGYCDESPLFFDGETIVFVANDVASADTPAFYYMTPGADAAGIDLPFEGSKDLDDYYAYVSGKLAVVADAPNHAIYRADLSDATPAFTEFTISNEPVGATGVYLAVIENGAVEVYDMSVDSDVTCTFLEGDDDPATDPQAFQTYNGIFTWVENGVAYYYEPGVSDGSDVIFTSGNVQSEPVAGPDYFLWNESGKLWYLAAGDDTPEEVGDYHDGESIRPGDGFFAYIADDSEGDEQIFVYDLSDLTATEGVQVTENGEGADSGLANWTSDSLLSVDGSKIYEIFNYRSISNPSRVLVVYDIDTDELTELTDDRDFQQTPVYLAAGGKAVFLHRDRHFRLFAKQADDTAKPVTLTPVSLRIDGEDCQQIALANGVVVFKAIDTTRFIDNPFLLDEVCQGEMREIYCIDLDGAREITQVTADTQEAPGRPQTDGTFVTWRDYEGYACGYNIATGKSKIIGPASGKVSVDGGIAVWRYDSDIYYYDLKTDEGDVIEDANPDDCPTIAGGLIAWEGNSQNPCYYDLNADDSEIVDIYAAAAPEDYIVAYVNGSVYTDGRFLTWQEERDAWDPDGEGTMDDIDVIVAYDTVNEEFLTIPAAKWSAIDDLCYPSISDGVVLFGAEEYGVANSDHDKEIFYCDLTTDPLALTRLTNDPNDDPETADDEAAGLWDSRPRIANGLIVWRTGGASNWDWYGRSVAAARIY